MPFDTPLNPAQEGDFLKWKQKHAPYDSGHDYDLRGAFQSGVTPDPQTGHWPDTFKKPNHPTFSDQSIYSSLTGTRPGTWQGETYSPFGYQMNRQPFWKALEGVVQGIRGMQTSKANPSLFHEPTVTAAQGVDQGVSASGNVLNDPRNAWLGIGPIAMAARPMGWGTEVLRRYNQMGGTPQTLNRVLANRMIDPIDRNRIVSGFRKGNDIAAPPTTYLDQPIELEGAGNTYQNIGHWGSTVPTFNRNSVNIRGGRERAEAMAEQFPNSVIESGAKGNAAYDAVSRQVGRMLDSAGYTGKRLGYGPEPALSREDIFTPEQARQFARERGYNIPR